MSQHSIHLNNVPITWNLEKGELNFFGIPSTLFWNNPSLLRMLQPLAKEIGTPLFKLLVAHSSSFGTGEDYHAMINGFSDNFEEGFLKWGEAVSAAGWGVFSLNFIDYENKTARVTITNPWELMMQQSITDPLARWGCPFMLGKVIGIFSHAFGVSVWADEYSTEGELKVEFFIYPSDKTIEYEIDNQRQQKMDEEKQALNAQVTEKTRQLEQAKEELKSYTLSLEKTVEKRTRQLEILSITDEMTGLFNRRHFNQIFQDEINRAKRDDKYLTFLLFDIDCFKQYNDTYGHLEGDNVLAQIGKLLLSLTKRANDFVFRVGGEEFALLTSGTEKDENRDIADKLLTQVEALGIPHTRNSGRDVITVSIGEVLFKPDNTTTLENIFVAGDNAMYEAKSTGKNRVVTVSV